MATCSYPLNYLRIRGWRPFTPNHGNSSISGGFMYYDNRNSKQRFAAQCCSSLFSRAAPSTSIELLLLEAAPLEKPFDTTYVATKTILINLQEKLLTDLVFMKRLVLADLDPATTKLAIGFLGPFLSAFSFLFILRIIMSWYPKLPLGKFPYVIAYAPTEPILIPTRKLIPPLGGVDVTPVVWFGLISFLNEILVGPQGLLVLLSQQVS